MVTQVIEVEEETEEISGIIEHLKGLRLSRDLKHNETAKWHKTSKLWLMRHARFLEGALKRSAARRGQKTSRAERAQLATGSGSRHKAARQR